MIMYQVLPGIKKIGIMPSDSLPDNVVEMSIAGLVVELPSAPSWLCLADGAKVDVDENYDNNAQYQKGVLEFKTEDDVPVKKVAFVIIDVEDMVWLYGRKEIPRLIIEHKYSTGAEGNSPAGHEYKVKFSAKKVLLPCILPIISEP